MISGPYIDALGHPIRKGDFVVCATGGGRYAPSRWWARAYDYTPKRVRVERPDEEGRWQRDEAGRNQWVAEYVGRSTTIVIPNSCFVVPYPAGAQPHCSGCKKPLALWEMNWLCTDKGCGAMYEWRSSLRVLYPQLKWQDEEPLPLEVAS